MKPITLITALACLMFASCTRYSYLQSPFHATNYAYRAIPLVADSIKSAVNLSGGLNIGGANYNLRDFSLSGHASVFHSLSSKYVQGYYGGTFTAGNYRIADESYSSRGGSSIFYGPGNRFFGGVGVIGGVNMVAPLRSGSEWRYIIVETSLQKEFGDYLRFRKNLPDSAADLISRNDLYGTVQIGTNIIKRFRRSGNSFGYKFACFLSTSRYDNRRWSDDRSVLPAGISNTLHFSRDKFTAYFQANFGFAAANFATGVSVRF